MTYEEKYKKYKQKYLNLFSKINVLEGGDRGEELYQEGLILLNQTKISEAVQKFEEAAKLGNMNAMNYLFDIYLLGRLGVPKNPMKCQEIIEKLELAEQIAVAANVPGIPPFMTRLPGILFMQKCYPDCFDIRTQSHELNKLWGDGIHHQDPRIAFLRFHMDDRNQKKLVDLSHFADHELSLFLKAKHNQNLADTQLPARRGIIEAIYLRGKFLLDNLEVGRNELRQSWVAPPSPDTLANFEQAKRLFRSIEQQCTQVEYDNPNNTILERAIVSLLRMGEQVPNFGRFEHPKDLVLCATDRFIFDISNIDNNIKIVSDLCANLVRTSARNTVGSRKAATRETRECILGEAIGSFDKVDSVSSLPIQDHLLYARTARTPGKFTLSENPTVDVTVSEAIMREAGKAQVALNSGRGGGRVFLFSGDGNDELDDLVAPHTKNRFPDSIFDSFKTAARANPKINFVVVCFKNSLAGCYKNLARTLRNVSILTFAEFIRGNIHNFLPLARKSVNLMSCVMHVLPTDWLQETRSGVIYYTTPPNVFGKTKFVSKADLPKDIPGIEIPLSSKLLEWEWKQNVAAAPEFVMPAATAVPHNFGHAVAAAPEIVMPAATAVPHNFGHAAAAVVDRVTRVPPNWIQLMDRGRYIDQWINVLDMTKVYVCPTKVGRDEWLEQLKKLEQSKQQEKKRAAIIHQFSVCYSELFPSRVPSQQVEQIISGISKGEEFSVNLLFGSNEDLKEYLKE